jgi:hypothetical protein
MVTTIPLAIMIRPALPRAAFVVLAVHIWTSSAQPWMTLPDKAPAFEKAPTPAQFQAALAK